MDTKSFEYGFKKAVSLPLEETDQRLRAELKKEGFGILTEIDVKATLKKKLDVEFRPYVILGACNPPMAHQALQAEIDIGLLLPCNVVVYQADEPGKSVVAAMDPEEALKLTGNPGIESVARVVRNKLESALGRLEA